MVSFNLRLVLVLMAGFMSSCGVSPLFNHKNAQDFKTNLIPNGQAAESGNKIEYLLSFPKSKRNAKLIWNKIPVSHLETYTFTLKFWNDSEVESTSSYQDPPDSNSVSVWLWMPSMGHGSAKVRIKKASQDGIDLPGIYLGRNVLFNMPKDWAVHVELRSGDVVQEEAVIHVNI